MSTDWLDGGSQAGVNGVLDIWSFGSAPLIRSPSASAFLWDFYLTLFERQNGLLDCFAGFFSSCRLFWWPCFAISPLFLPRLLNAGQIAHGCRQFFEPCVIFMRECIGDELSCRFVEYLDVRRMTRLDNRVVTAQWC